MNARLYDPVISRFFSPDPYVQLPEFTQAFNRYSYCLNNPLKYVDPSGELWLMGEDWFERPNGSIYWYDNAISQATTPEGERYIGKTVGFCDNAGFLYNGDENGNLIRTNISVTVIADELSNFTTSLNGTTNAIGGFGGGMFRIGGTFRLTNGDYNGSQMSLKHYTSNWQGGSRAGITTYSMTKWGSWMGRGSIGVSFALGGFDIYQGYEADGGTYGYNAQKQTASAIGGIGGSAVGTAIGAKIGAGVGVWIGGVGAIPGAIIGGTLGGILGGWGGSKVGKKGYEKYRK